MLRVCACGKEMSLAQKGQPSDSHDGYELNGPCINDIKWMLVRCPIGIFLLMPSSPNCCRCCSGCCWHIVIIHRLISSCQSPFFPSSRTYYIIRPNGSCVRLCVCYSIILCLPGCHCCVRRWSRRTGDTSNRLNYGKFRLNKATKQRHTTTHLFPSGQPQPVHSHSIIIMFFGYAQWPAISGPPPTANDAYSVIEKLSRLHKWE